MRSLQGFFFYTALPLLLLLLSSKAAASDATTATTTTPYVISDVEECLECTRKGCWHCEAEHQYTVDGKHFSMCECGADISVPPQRGYCGPVFAHFNRYANSERLCVGDGTVTVVTDVDNTGLDGDETSSPSRTVSDEKQKQQLSSQQQDNSSAATIVLLIGLLPVFCCLGFCSGCGLFYYYYHLKKEVDEEKRIRECTALMKVVTARDLAEHYCGNTVSVEEDFSHNTTTTTYTLDGVEQDDDEEQQQQNQSSPPPPPPMQQVNVISDTSNDTDPQDDDDDHHVIS